jgi:hypothetical protein
MRTLIRRIASIFALALCAALGSPAYASLHDQFPCQSDDHYSLLVYISAFDSNQAVLQAMKENDEEAHIHKLAMNSGGSWKDFRYEDKEHHTFVGGNGKGVLLMHGKAYVCEFAGDPGEEQDASEVMMLIGVLLNGEGLDAPAKNGSGFTKLRFGESRDTLVAALSPVLGPPGQASRNEECGAGPMSFLSFGPLTANFHDGVWVGWMLGQQQGGSNAKPVRLKNGAAIGSPISTLAGKPEYYDDSTLGDEFMVGQVSGLSGGRGQEATIDTLWAGTNCLFR